MRAGIPTLRFGFILSQEFSLSSFSTLVERLKLVTDGADNKSLLSAEWRIVGEAEEIIRSSCGVELRPHEALQQPQQFDYLVMIGGGTENVTSAKTSRFLRRAANAQVVLVCVADAAYSFARLGFLDGYTVCLSEHHAKQFNQQYPNVQLNHHDEFVADRDRLSALGVGGVVQFVEYAIARHQGSPGADDANQPPYIARDPIVKAAMIAIEQCVGRQCDLQLLAKHFALSARQLQRRFVADIGISAREYRGHLRACRARWLTEHSTMSLTQVGAECGFSDAAHFSSSFRRYFGQSPSTLRRYGRNRRESFGKQKQP